MKFLQKLLRKESTSTPISLPEGSDGIAALGHREYVGGCWDEIGDLQFDFLIRQGLQPSTCFLDIACGSLRAGTRLIRYLDAGNYLGLDKEQELIELGIERELGRSVCEAKRPEFVVSGHFEFERFSKQPSLSIAQSLFTHLIERDIRLCLANLRRFVGGGHSCFATYREGESSQNPNTSHSLGRFRYSEAEMSGFGADCGWKATAMGDWGHPRGQLMMRYEAS